MYETTIRICVGYSVGLGNFISNRQSLGMSQRISSLSLQLLKKLEYTIAIKPPQKFWKPKPASNYIPPHDMGNNFDDVLVHTKFGKCLYKPKA